MSDDRPVVICGFTDRPPSVDGARRAYCELCAEEVWLSPSSLAIAPNIMIVCGECAPGIMMLDANPQFMPMTPQQAAELRRAGLIP